MLGLILRNEWKRLRRDKLALIVGGILLLTIVYAVVGGLEWQRLQARDGEKISEEIAAGVESLAPAAAESPGVGVGSVKTFAALPAGPLSFLAVGVADLHPSRAEISIWKRPDNLFGWYQFGSPLSLLAGRFDLAFVLIYLLPLLILALSYNLLSSERESGTLGLVLAHPISLGRLLAAKVLLRFALVFVPMAMVIVLGVAIQGVPSGDLLLRSAGWVVITALYAGFWFALAAWINACGWRSETNAIVLAASWVGLVLVLPALLNIGLQSVSPVPSRLEYVTAMRSASSEAAKQTAELLSEYYHEHPELSANGRQEGFLPAFYAAQREVDRRLAPLLADYERRLQRQQELVGRGRFLSPAVVAQEALLDLSGTGLERQRRFTEQARAFLARWHQQFSPRIFLGQNLDRGDLEALPTFSFVEPGVPWFRWAAGSLGLLLPTLLCAGLSRRRLQDFPVTG